MVAFNFDHVAEILRSMDIENADAIVEEVRHTELTVGEHGWSDGTLACWLKNGVRFRCGEQSPMLDGIETARLHVFPISYTETPEGLARIRNDKTLMLSEVARSKVSTTNEVIHPIDRVAARVTLES